MIISGMGYSVKVHACCIIIVIENLLHAEVQHFYNSYYYIIARYIELIICIRF